MKGVMKFELNEEVLIAPTGEIGRIIQLKYEKYYSQGLPNERITYRVAVNESKFGSWYEEGNLKYPNTYDKEFEIGLLDLLINVNLLNVGNTVYAKQFYNEKIRLMEENK
ncbi:hypothetical protein [Lederbergia lenta]|uniref:hypothetical protein n=1 Tax=Lederbergia lenta TaxID=1467 RepID=UPI00203BD41D|nr:hypothetical protein [Lederbergia lenta]MCM3109874.1 hypothetical protein [Lederbergia lenta]